METDEQPESLDKQKKTKKQSKQIELRIEAEYREYPQNVIQGFIESENEMRSQDKAEKEKADARNTLEEYIYEARDKVSGDHGEYVTDSVRKFKQIPGHFNHVLCHSLYLPTGCLTFLHCF